VDNSSVDNSSVTISTKSISGCWWGITFSDTCIKIGCQNHTHEEWENFTDEDISQMHPDALEWWNEWKGFILSLSIKHRKDVSKK